MLADFEFVRVERNPWGQETLLGLSWDLLWVFAGLALLFVVAHSLYTWLWVPHVKKRFERGPEGIPQSGLGSAKAARKGDG